MIARRIVPCLDVKGGRVVKGVRFRSLVDQGDPVEQALAYDKAGADELVFLDITATAERRGTLVDLVERVARTLSIPFTVGGGVSSLDDVRALLLAGADKVSLNSAAVREPSLLTRAAEICGSQSVVVAIDARREEIDDSPATEAGAAREGPIRWRVFTHGGKRATDLDAVDWACEAVRRGAGEILLTSIDRDGTRVGFDLPLVRAVAAAVPVPVIASGGAGSAAHFVALFRETPAAAGLAASIFHTGDVPVGAVKAALAEAGVLVRPVEAP